MSETMSNPSNWAQLYQQNLSNQATSGRVTSGNIFSDRVSDATIVTTTASAPSPLGSAPSGSTTAGSHLSPEGRVSKPVRRRSRASRRTPTTLLNTDTTNFRAMVQQFTGGPSAPFASGAHTGAPSFSLGIGGRPAHVNPSAPVMLHPGGYHLQVQYQQLQPNQQYMFPLGNNNPGDAFLQRLGSNPNPNPNANVRPAMEGSDGFGVEGVSSQVPNSRTCSSNENRSNAFLF